MSDSEHAAPGFDGRSLWGQEELKEKLIAGKLRTEAPSEEQEQFCHPFSYIDHQGQK
jgi:hypothetical protein